MGATEDWRRPLQAGLVIPALPLALTARRRFDERRQRAVIRYYLAAGAGGVAVGVHTTQFAIRDPAVGLFEPVLSLAAEELSRTPKPSGRRAPLPPIRIAGVCGETRAALKEATLAVGLGFHAGLLSLGAFRSATERELIAHCEAVAEVIPIIGFYLQPAVGGRVLSYAFWRRFAEIDRVVAIKIAPFNRYQTLDVIRAVTGAGRTDLALYTGNDDAIISDLVTPFEFAAGGRRVRRTIVGGLLGHWAVWTRRAVELHATCRRVAATRAAIPPALLKTGVAVTDMNAAVFDAANGFRGCIAGVHEVLRRQGLFAGTWCLDPEERLSPGQSAELDRVCAAYPQLTDDAFIAQHRDEWLA